jgi:hypothetical protein
LCDGFIRSKYDLKWLHRTILNSRTYQQSSALNASNRTDRRNYASFYLRRLPAEVLLDVVDRAVGHVPAYSASQGQQKLVLPPGTRLLEGGSLVNRNDQSAAGCGLEAFGRPARDVEEQCDCERENDATMIQALFLANHPQIRAKIADPKGRIAQLVKEHTEDARRIEEVYLWTVSRFPNEEERRTCLDYLRGSGSPQQGLEGIQWALLNSDEFLFNH